MVGLRFEDDLRIMMDLGFEDDDGFFLNLSCDDELYMLELKKQRG
jgi:hypothetical protein